MTDTKQEVLAPQCISAYEGHAARFPADGPWCIAFSPDGKYIASASPAGVTVHVWETQSTSLIAAYMGHRDRVNALAWTAYRGDDGKELPAIASASNDQTVRVWEALTGVHLFTHVHQAEVVAVASTLTEAALAARGFPLTSSVRSRAYLSLPASPLIASADGRGPIHVWRAGDDAAQLVYTGHSGPVRSVTFSPLPSASEGYFGEEMGYIGYLLASVVGEEGGTVAHIWLAESGKLCRVVRGSPFAGPVVWAPFAALESGMFIFDGTRRFLNIPDAAVSLKEQITLLSVDGNSPQLISRDEDYLYVRMAGPPLRIVARFALPSEAQGAVLHMQAVGRDACRFAFGTRQGAIMTYAMSWVDRKFAVLKRV